jgi:hypothetical protein
MMSEAVTILSSVCLGIALAAASGMRVFLPLFLSGLVIRFGWFGISPAVMESQAWLGSSASLICFGVATVTEAIAYKVPVLDHVLDVLGAPAALLAGAVLATSFLVGVEDPVVKYGLGIVAGAGSAGIVHGTTALARVASTKTTGGIANPFLAISELIGAVMTSILAFVMPILIAVAFVIFTIALLYFAKRKLTAKSV